MPQGFSGGAGVRHSEAGDNVEVGRKRAGAIKAVLDIRVCPGRRRAGRRVSISVAEGRHTEEDTEIQENTLKVNIIKMCP